MKWEETKKPVPLKLNLIELAEHIYYKEEENKIETLVAINCNKNISQSWPLKTTSEKLLWLLINHLRCRLFHNTFKSVEDLNEAPHCYFDFP